MSTSAKVLLIGAFGLTTSFARIDEAACQDAPVWRLVEDVGIGADYDFTRILAILPLDDGSSIIADRGNQEIAVFDPAGRYVRRIGGSGRGPGEFVRLQSVGLLGDTLWVVDGGERRVSLFSLHGDHIATAATKPGVYLVAVLRGGGAVGVVSSILGSGSAPVDSVLPVLLTSRGAPAGDTVGWVSGRNDNLVIPRSDGSFSIARQRFTAAGLILAAPGSNAFFIVDRSVARRRDAASFRVAALGFNGDTLWSRSYSYKPKPLHKARGDSLLAALGSALARSGHTPEEIRRAVFIPEFYPPVTSAATASDGSLWLRREEGGDTVVYTVIDRNGSLAATVRVAATVTIMAGSESTVWGVRTDDLDVPSVLRYRLRR